MMNAEHNPTAAASLDRREFLKLGTWAGGALLVGTYLDFGAATAQGAAGGFGGALTPPDPNVFIHITPDNKVALMAPNSEMGQGAKTALPMIIAEELDVPWSSVTVYQADLNPAYGRQAAVGSGSTSGNYARLRQAGAMARAKLIHAAELKWSVPAATCTAANGVVSHLPSGRTATYGELAEAAAALPVPSDYPLKDPKDFKLIGTRVAGVDNPKIVTGQALFGIDQKLPGLLYAAYVKCPVYGGKPVSANLEEVKKLPGVRDAFILDGVRGLTSGVAIVANSTWNAFSASEKLTVQWDEGAGAGQNSDDFAKQAEVLGKTPAVAPVEGAKNLEAVYHYPFLAHATLEPQNCTALFKNGVMEMWCPTQVPSSGQGLVTQGLGLAADKVVVHVTRVGGGFGRRGSNEFSLEVAVIAQKFEGTPIKLTWMREHDMRSDNFRSNGWHYFNGAVDGSGKIVALADHFVKIQGQVGGMNGGGFPFNAVAGSSVQQSLIPGNIPTGYWRAPGDNGNCWAVQSFLDELAHAAGRDPVAFQSELQLAQRPGAGGRGGAGGAANGAKMNDVIKLAAEKANWGKQLPRGQGRGLATSFTNGSMVAIVAEVTVSPAGELKVDRLVAAVDAGLVVNLSSAEAQVQGAMIDGLGAAWFLKITIVKGRTEQDNFDQYPLLRMSSAPTAVEVHFIPSQAAPNGLGEPALPPVAPAVCNAIFAATGKRVHTLPISGEDLKWS